MGPSGTRSDSIIEEGGSHQDPMAMILIDETDTLAKSDEILG